MIKSILKFKSFFFLTVILIISAAPSLHNKKALLLGDSTSILYGPFLKKYICSKYELRVKGNISDAVINLNDPKGANAGDSRMVLDYLKHLAVYETKFNDDIILLNCGLHDIKSDRKSLQKQVSLAEYKNNLDSIFTIVKNLGIQLIWINSTPVIDSIHNSKNVGFYRFNKDVEEYNKTADSLFKCKGVPIIDLYSFSKAFPTDSYSDHVHFHPKYADLQAAYIAGFLMNKDY